MNAFSCRAGFTLAESVKPVLILRILTALAASKLRYLAAPGHNLTSSR
jgi:hypothetical protein